MSAKPARKSVDKSKAAPRPTVGNLRPFKPGPNPKRGRGPKPGAPNAGRPSNEFREYMQTLVTKPEVRQGIEEILTDLRIRSDPQRARLYLDAFNKAAEHAYPNESGSLEVKDGDRTIKVSFG